LAFLLLCAGRVRTKTVKKASRWVSSPHDGPCRCRHAPARAQCSPHPVTDRRVIIEKYYQRLTQDFDTNKRICEEVAIIQSKRLRNKIAGFTTVSSSTGQGGAGPGPSGALRRPVEQRRRLRPPPAVLIGLTSNSLFPLPCPPST
jgi:ribosomal protein S17E